jgi:hypothetical protein
MRFVVRIFRRFIKWIFILLIILASLPFLLYVPLIYDRDFYKDKLITLVELVSDYDLQMSEFGFLIYPYLNINMDNVFLKTKEKQHSVLELQSLRLKVYYLPLIAGGRINLNEFSLKNGFLDLPLLLNSLPKSEPKEEKEESDPQAMLDFLNEKLLIEGISIENFELRIKAFHKSILHNPILENIKIQYKSLEDIDSSLLVVYGETKLNSQIQLGTTPKKIELSSLHWNIHLDITNLNLSEYSQYLIQFPYLRLQNSIANLKLHSNKPIHNLNIKNTLDFNLNRLGYLNKENLPKSIGPITINGEISYPLLTKKIQTRNLNILLTNLAHLNIQSNLDFQTTPNLNLQVRSDFLNINTILDFTTGFRGLPSKQDAPTEKPKKASSPQISLDLDYQISNLYYDHYRFHDLYLKSRMRNSTLNYNTGLRRLAGGYVHVNGDVSLKDGLSVTAQVEMEKVDLEKLTKEFLDKKFAEGTMSSYVTLSTDNLSGEKDLLKNLNLTGNTYIKDGILHDKADILYTIRFLNKIIPEDKKMNSNLSRFNTINLSYIIKNNKFKVRNLAMDGKIFNALGSVDIGLDDPKNDIRANLIVSTSIAGAGLKIPMVYSKSDYVPFVVDKVWLTSVYAGMIMGGPMGALIGSAISETSGATFQSITDTTKEQFEENKAKFLKILD